MNVYERRWLGLAAQLANHICGGDEGERKLAQTFLDMMARQEELHPTKPPEDCDCGMATIEVREHAHDCAYFLRLSRTEERS